MTAREQARSTAKDLALEGLSTEQIADALHQRGLGGTLSGEEIQFIASEARFAKSLIRERPNRTIPRIVGMMAILLGIAGLWIGRDGPHVRGYSPGGFGLGAIILGCLLLFMPSSAHEKL